MSLHNFHQLKVLRPPRRLGSLKPLFQINLYHRMLHQSRSYLQSYIRAFNLIPECCELNFLLHIGLSPNACLTSKSFFRKTLFQIFAVYEGCYIRGLRSEPSCCEHNILLVYIGNIVLFPKSFKGFNHLLMQVTNKLHLLPSEIKLVSEQRALFY